jgi:predicted dehydrogenase
MRVAFAGVAHSHPFSDAAGLVARGAEITGVWDRDDPERRRDFSARFGAPELPGLVDLLALNPDVVVATPRTSRAAEVAGACAAAGIPVFANKTIAADAAGLARWDALPAGARFTSSVLRFAPGLGTFATTLRGERVHAVEVHAQHDIAGFLAADRRWQDEPSGAGGTLVNIGVHAWEMLDVVLPGGRAEIRSAVRTTGGSRTASELLGSVHAVVDGIPVSVTIAGVGGADRYAVRVWTDRGMRELVLPDDADGLGYGATADAVCALARGVVPVDPSRTSAVYRNAIAAAEAARRDEGFLGRETGAEPRLPRGHARTDGDDAGSETT